MTIWFWCLQISDFCIFAMSFWCCCSLEILSNDPIPLTYKKFVLSIQSELIVFILGKFARSLVAIFWPDLFVTIYFVLDEIILYIASVLG